MKKNLKKNGEQGSQNCLLKRVERQELAAKKFGFYWENVDQLIDQIQSECQEIQEALDEGDTFHIQEEIGDLIQAAISVAIFCGFDPHDTLLKSIDKFQKRYDALVELARRDGHEDLHEKSFDVLVNYWKRAKQH